MATYLQGVSDYIPQFQPFQPDLNFYNNVLQTKQTQYDSNYKAINKIYGQYFYADLTHDDNIKRKDELLKNIDFNLKKISGLDLSLEQNVTQATQVFKPFYEDKYLMKDMAFTKNYNNQKGRAEGLKNSDDEEKRSQYWEAGVRALDYKREEFKNADIANTLDFGNVSYTNYVNVQDKAIKLAKEAGLSIETVDFSPDGKYIVTTKNGEQLQEPLSKLLESSLGSDPAIQEVYKTQAYVNRKDFAYSNAAQFNGDQNAAEMKYLEDNFNMLKKEQQDRYIKLKETNDTYTNQIKDIESQIAKGSKDPKLKSYLASLKQSQEINSSVLSRVEKDADFLKTESSTATTSTGFENPYGDIKSLRYKVDNAMASRLMQKDLDQAAEILAYKDAKQSIEADPFAVQAQNHAYRMQETALANQGRMQAAALRNKGEKQANMDKYLVESGAYHYDTDRNSKTYGQVVKNEQYDNTFVDTENEGNSTPEVNMKNLSRTIANRQTSTYATPYIQQALTLVDKLVKQGVMSESQANSIFQSAKNKNMTRQEFNTKFQANPESFLRNDVGTHSMEWISRKLDWWVKNNSKLQALSTPQELGEYINASNNFKNYSGYLSADQKWRKDSSKIITQQLVAKGFSRKEAEALYDHNGRLRSESEFYNILNRPNEKNKSYTKWDAAKDLYWNSSILDWIKLGSPTSQLSGASGLANTLVEGKKEKAAQELYNKMVAAAGKAYSSSNIKALKAPPAISTIGEMSGTGLFTTGRQSVYVSPKAYDTKGYAYMKEFERDFRKMDFGGTGAKNNITFMGPTGTGLLKDNIKNDTGKKLVDAILQEMNNSKTKYHNFKLSSQLIAGGSSDKGAMIITPDPEWLKEHVYKLDKNGNPGAGLISETDYNNILLHGVSIIANPSNFQNGLFQSSYLDPIQAQIEYNGKYQYQDPWGNVDLLVEKNPYGTGDYIYTAKTNVLDHNTGEYINNTYVGTSSTTGNNTANVVNTYRNMSDQIQMYNLGR